MFVKKKLKREDFLIENGWFQSLVRKPGELQMQQFQISDCEECTIALFDAAACVYVDECKYCTIFVGACEASVFVRDCSQTTVICTTQQFRVRDCSYCHFSLCCQSQPIIESSRNITISNFPVLAYPQMSSHMQQTKTTPWNNNWFDVYDFTPHKFNTVNFQLSPLPAQQQKEVRRKIKQKLKEAGLQITAGIIPRTIGKGNYTINDFGVLVAYPVPPPFASQDHSLLQSRVHRITADELRQLGVDLNCQGRASVLFVKVLRGQMDRWRGRLQNIVLQVLQTRLLQLYEGAVFAPFKDEH